MQRIGGAGEALKMGVVGAGYGFVQLEGQLTTELSLQTGNYVKARIFEEGASGRLILTVRGEVQSDQLLHILVMDMLTAVETDGITVGHGRRVEIPSIPPIWIERC